MSTIQCWIKIKKKDIYIKKIQKIVLDAVGRCWILLDAVGRTIFLVDFFKQAVQHVQQKNSPSNTKVY